jgi:tRNA pseudouridine55 synthase
LIRTESSSFHLANSLTLTDLEAQTQAGIFQPIAPDAALQHLPSVTLSVTPAQKWCQGQRVSLTVNISGMVRVYEEETRFLGIGQLQDEVLIPQMVFEPI